MTDKEKLERIKAKVKEFRQRWYAINTDFATGQKVALTDVLSFIDSVQEETKDKCKGCNNVKGCITCVDGSEWAHYEEPVSEDIEKEIDHAHKLFYEEVGWDSDEGARAYVADWFAYYFAKWQKEQDGISESKDLDAAAREYSGKESHPLNGAFKAGAAWQKQQDQEHPDKESFAKRLKLEKEEWEDEYRQQMMKEAVEATVMHYYSQSKEGFNGRVIFCSDSLDYLKTGDKVNIKVFKED